MYWPKHILIDHNSFIRYEHAGYGTIEDFENAVVELLEEAGHKLTEHMDSENPNDEIFDIYGMHFDGIVPEICVGYSRLGRFGNNQTMRPNEPNIAIDSGPHVENVVYLSGKWIWGREGVRFCTGGKEKNPAIMMKYSCARRVHGIIGTSDGKIGRVEVVKIDDNYLTKEQLGKHMKLKDDISYADIEWSFVHNLIRSEKPEVREVQIVPRSDNFTFYTFVSG